jgi:hypothetical protein
VDAEPFDHGNPRSRASTLNAVEDSDFAEIGVSLQPVAPKLSRDR